MTTNAWNTAAEMADKHASQGGIFIKLANDGDKVVGAFCGEPFAKEVVWTGERYEEYDKEIHSNKRPGMRVMLNFFVPEENAMKIIEGGVTWFRDVIKCRDKYGFDNWTFEIARQGAAGDSRTTYSILPEVKIDTTLKAKIDACELYNLLAIDNGEYPETENTGASLEDNPIEQAQVTELVNRLKALPKSDVNEFLQKFSIQRVRDIKVSQYNAARAMLVQLESKYRQEEVDPFA